MLDHIIGPSPGCADLQHQIPTVDHDSRSNYVRARPESFGPINAGCIKEMRRVYQRISDREPRRSIIQDLNRSSLRIVGITECQRDVVSASWDSRNFERANLIREEQQ